jgi:hypothetical protein
VAAQFPKNVAVLRCHLAFQWPEPHAGKQALQCTAVGLSTFARWERCFQLTEYWNAGAYSDSLGDNWPIRSRTRETGRKASLK